MKDYLVVLKRASSAGALTDAMALLAGVRGVVLSPAQIEAQRSSFAYGNARLEDDSVTKEAIDRAAERIRAADGRITVGFVKAETPEEAVAKAADPDVDVDTMEWVRVVGIDSNDDGAAWREFSKMRKAAIAAEKEAAKRKKEEAEFERLRKKLGK